MSRALVLLVCCTCTFALNPDLDVSQYAHKSWTMQDGFFRSDIGRIVQTPDGYLWLGTQFGLLRFDGDKFTAWDTISDQHLPSDFIRGLLAARDGTLWIGTFKGLVSWKSGRLTQYPELAGFDAFRILEDREGTIWVGAVGTPTGRLCRIKAGSVQCHGEDGSLGRGVTGLYEDGKGNLWASGAMALWRWKPGAPKFYPLPGEFDSIQSLAEAGDGALLFAGRSGVWQFSEGGIEKYRFPRSEKVLNPRKLLRDREGSLWIGTAGGGLVHVHSGRTDVFSLPDGLSGESVLDIFEDREGNVWVATTGGLDRFHDVAAATPSVSQGLSNAPYPPILADRDGSVWLNTRSGLNRWKNGQITIYGRRNMPLPSSLTRRSLLNVFPEGVTSLYQDDQGRIWVATPGGFGYLENDRFVQVGDVPARYVTTITKDAAGNLWIGDRDLGLLRLSPDQRVQQIPWAALGGMDAISTLAPDPLEGGLWVGFSNAGLAYFKDGQVSKSYATAQGLGQGRVIDLRSDREGTVWASTEGGLSRLKNGHISTLSSKNGLPCDAVHWSMEDDGHDLWFYMPCGLVRVARPELDAWGNDPKRAIHATVLGSADGVRLVASPGGYSPRVSKAPDGKLWFGPAGDASVVDPHRVPFNQLPPPVQIEQIVADRKTYRTDAALKLPPLTRDLEIDYTALSLVAPETNRFRYKLEGRDSDWQDPGTRRQAFYDDLGPRNYRFRVMASNNSGVWNEAGASFDFSVAPAYYQTTWFQGLCVLAGAGMLWLLYRLRLRQVTARVNLLYNERLGERTRIARDLHDTLLQSLAGVSLQLDGISKLASKAPEKVPSLIARVRDQVDSAFREARVKVWNLRSTSLEAQGLEGALRQLVERMGPATKARCEVAVSGEPRPCSHEVEEELLRIAQEAANNANRHAQASEILITLDYNATLLTLTIADDGRGFDFEEGYGKSGHWGLKNMQERAAQIRGACSITTAAGQGTRIEVCVPLSSPWSFRNTLAKHAGSNSR